MMNINAQQRFVDHAYTESVVFGSSINGRLMDTQARPFFNIVAKLDTVYCVVRCHAGMPELTKVELLSAFQDSSFAYHQLQTDNLDDYLAQVNQRAALVSVEESEPEMVKFPIAKAIDAQLEVRAEDKDMRGIAILTTARGGTPISAKEIKRVCIESGFKYGLKSKLVTNLITLARNSEPGSVIEQTIILGKPVENGKDAYLQPMVKLFSESTRSPTVFADGRFDMRDLGDIQSVAIGQVIAQKVAATQGTPGIDVYGKKLAPKSGADFELKDTESTEISPDNPNFLVATKQGLLRQDGNKVVVDDVFKVKQLTARDGHIKFDGSVIVEKDIDPDMRIEASGDVFVGGFVQSGTIICSGNLTIVGGTSGKKNDDINHDNTETKQQLTCHLKAKAISVSFASSTELIAENEIIVSKQLTNCYAEAENLIIGDIDNPNGKVIGGELYLAESLITGELGNDSELPVKVNVNRAFDETSKKELLLWQKLETLDMQKVELATHSEYQLDEAVITDLKNELVKITKQQQMVEQARKLLQQQRAELSESLQLLIFQGVHRNVQIKMTNKTLLTDEPKRACRVKLVENEISIEPMQ